MRKLFTILAAFLLTARVFLPQQASAQSPEKMSYQAVIRNSNDQLVTNQTVGMQISILQGSESGTTVYVETQTPTTNANGLVSIEIGGGAGFDAIDWSAGPYFIKTETDPTGSTSYTITGTSQLLSVPYALHAKTADNGITPEQANAIVANTAKVGITTEQADAIVANTEKVGITTEQADAIVANTAKVGYTDALVSANADVAANTAKVGITTAQADAITANTAKVGYTDALVSANADVVANTAKVSAATGTQAGEMQYWNGTAWVNVPPGNTGNVLTLINGVPTWGGPGIGMGTNDVYNPITGRIWSDRNLGATYVATSSTAADSYGHLYQWGRAADGHQIKSSGTTSTLSNSDTPGHGDFITNNNQPVDWRNPQNDNLWQGVSGVNNPCPSGYRLPTEAEWNAERLSWSSNDAAGAFASPLKLPVAGYRAPFDGSLSLVGSYGLYWSSTVDGTYSSTLTFEGSDAYMFGYSRGRGFSVRCLKD